jgi:hypothetical protein
MTVTIADLVLKIGIGASYEALTELRSRLYTEAAVLELITVIYEAATHIDEINSKIFVLAVHCFHKLRCSIPDRNSLWRFFELLDLPQNPVLHEISEIIIHKFSSTANLMDEMKIVPMTPGHTFCLLRSLIFHEEEGVSDFNGIFLDALCAQHIPVEQRLAYAHFLALLEGDNHARDWTPVERFLSICDDSLDFVKLLGALLAPEGCFAPDELRRRLLVLIPPLEELYSAQERKAGRLIIAEAIEGILRVCPPTDDWVEEVEIPSLFEACWKLLNPHVGITDSADDFFGIYVASDSEEDLPCDTDLHQKILCLMNSGSLMLPMAKERITKMEVLDIPAVRILEFWNEPGSELLSKFENTSSDPLLCYFMCQYFRNHDYVISPEIFSALFAGSGFVAPMLGISLLDSVPVEHLPPAEVLVSAITRGLSVVDEFETERVIEYVTLLSRVVGQCLKVGCVRCMLTQCDLTWFTTLWERLMRRGPGFMEPVGRLLGRFIRYAEFEELIGPLIVKATAMLFELNWQWALDFASAFVLTAPTLFPEELNSALAGALQMAINCGDWGRNVNDVMLYFAMQGVGVVADMCLCGLQNGVPSEAMAHFLTAVIGVMWTTQDMRVLDCLLKLSWENEEFGLASAVPVVTAVLSLSGKPLSVEHASAAGFLCCRFLERGFSRCSLDDRFVLGLECQLLTDWRGILEDQLWQEMHANAMTALEKGLTGPDLPISLLSSFYVKHKKLFRNEFSWIFGDWQSYVDMIIRQLRLTSGGCISG